MLIPTNTLNTAVVIFKEKHLRQLDNTCVINKAIGSGRAFSQLLKRNLL